VKRALSNLCWIALLQAFPRIFRKSSRVKFWRTLSHPHTAFSSARETLAARYESFGFTK
jgi:hypothetical protein